MRNLPEDFSISVVVALVTFGVAETTVIEVLAMLSSVVVAEHYKHYNVYTIQIIYIPY